MGYLGSNATFTGTQNNKRVSVIATQGQTLFTVSGGYAINAIDVYRNGVKLSGQRDFTALDGASVTLVSAANADDILEFVIFENFQREDVVTGDGDSVINGNLQINGDLGIVGGTLNATVSNTNIAGIATEAIRAGIATQVDGFLGVGVTGTNLNVTGVITATQFSGNITGVAATFSGDLSADNITVSGTLTYDDVTNIDSVGLITARNGLQVLAGITTISGQTNLTNTNVTAGILSATGQTNLANVNVSAAATVVGSLKVGSNTLVTPDSNADNFVIDTGDVDSGLSILSATTGRIYFGDAADDEAGSIRYVHTDNSMRFETNSTEKLRVTSTGGVHFNNAELIERVNITAGKLSDNTTINLDNGMVHYFTTAESTTAIPNITTTVGINTNMATGDTMSVTIITTAAAAGYSTGARIDAGATLPVLWNGGSDPSTGGSGGVDAYTYQIIKTGDAAFTVLGNVSNFA